MRKLLFIMLTICTFSSCSKDDNGAEDKSIIVLNETQLNQTVYADQISGTSGVSFTTAGAWTSSITESTTASASDNTTKAGIPNWISIDPASGDKAGSYNLNIPLSENLTGEKRTATITITCNGQTISITITQDGKTEAGEVPISETKVKKINGAEVLYHNDYIVKSIGDESFVNKAYSDIQWAYTGGAGSYSWYCNYEYGVNGMMIKVGKYNYRSQSNPEGYLVGASDFFWEGNTLKYINGDKIGVSGNPMKSSFEYSDTQYNKGNLDINFLVAGSDYHTGLPVAAIGIKTMRHLPLISKRLRRDPDNGNKYDADFTYRYVFNEQGYITQIYETVNWVNGENGEFLMYTFEY